MPRKLRITPQKTHPLNWLAAILCIVVAIAVIIVGATVLIGYVVIHPRVPFISVTSAHLDPIQFDAVGLLGTQLAIDLRAENDNERAHARFSDVGFVLSLHGLPLATLANLPFDVKKNSSVDFHYVVQASSVPLDSMMFEYVAAAVREDRIAFDLKGKAHARWRVGFFGSAMFWCHLDCRLQFHPYNGSYISSHCNSKSR